MYKPVLFDGCNYEERALMKHLKNSDLSPFDNKTKITANSFILNIPLKNKIEEFVKIRSRSLLLVEIVLLI